MERFVGKGVVEGIVSGKVMVPEVDMKVPEKGFVKDTEREVGRFKKAVEIGKEELTGLYTYALRNIGEEHAMIFDIHKLMLEDGDLLEGVEELIRTEKVSAEYAVHTVGETFSSIFSDMEDEYMKERAIDITDVANRLIRILSNRPDEALALDEPRIVLADDLTPSDTVKMDRSKILAFATVKGSANSHTAILAKALDIPTLVNVEIRDESLLVYHGKDAIVDGVEEVLYIDPDETLFRKKRMEEERLREEKRCLKALKGKENRTRDGREIEVLANIGDLNDIDAVFEYDAGGVGLFRSEYLYLGREDMPDEEWLFRTYKQAAERLDGKRLVIRTLDAGADKRAGYLNLREEENPALGFRAIRICFERIPNFKAQIRAIFRAALFGNVAILFPMIASLWEVKKIKNIMAEVKEEMKREGVSYGEPNIGIMIETPAAAVISDLLAKEVDFFSIGTNDLTQYTLAIDRQNEHLSKYYDARHEAVLRLIELTVRNAHASGIRAGICGELAADTDLTERFLDMGVDMLSVAPPKVLMLREKIRSISSESWRGNEEDKL